MIYLLKLLFIVFFSTVSNITFVHAYDQTNNADNYTKYTLKTLGEMIIKNYKNLSDYQMFEYCVNYDTALNPVDYFNSIFNDAAYRAFSENIHYKLANNLASFHRNKSISPTQYYIKQMNDLRTSTNESEFLNIDAMKLFRPDSKSKYVFMLESLRESVFKDYRLIIQNCKAKNFNKALDIALSNYNTESDFLKYSNIQTIAARQLISRLTILSGNIEKFYKQQSDILILQMDPHPEALLVNNEYFNPIYAEENLYLALKIDIALNSAYLYCANNNYDIAFPLLDEILSLENKAKVILNAGYKSNVLYEYGNPNHFFKFIKNFKKRLEIFSSSRENEFKSILTINNNQPENIVNTAHFISDALAKAASADIVFLPKNLFWNPISQGDFTANNLYQTLPEEISLMRGYVTGFDIKKFFDISFVPLLYKSMESHLSFYTTGILDIRYPGGVRNSIKTKNNLDFHDTELYEIIFPANELILDNAQNGSFFINAKNKGEIGNLHDILIKFFSKNKNFGNHKPTDRIFTLNKCPSNKTPEALFNIDFENYKQSNKIYSLEDQYNNNIDFLCIDFKYKDLTKYIIEFYKNKISDDYHNIYYCLYNNWNKEFIAVKKYFLSNLPDIKAKDKFSVQYYFMIAKILYNMEEYGISFKYLMAYKNSYENEDDFFTFENGSLLKDLSDKLGVKTDETIKIKIANKIYNLKNQINLLKQFYKKKIAGEKIKNEIQKTNISELDTIKLLIPRYGHCCVTDSLYLYSIGGFASDTDALGVIERLNTQTGQSEILTDKIIKRGFAAAQILNGKIYIFGGESKKQNGFRIIYDDLEIFDIESKKIILNEKMPLSLTKSASVVFEDTIYIVGGFTFQKLKFNSGVLFAYNTKSKEWSECQEMNEVKETSAIIDGDGIYIFGGANGKKSYNKIDKYSIPENSWTEEIDNLYLKIKGCPCVYYDGVVYIFGKNTGRNAWGKYHKKGFVIKYCKETGTSFSITEFKKRNFFAAALCGNKIYITGGQTINDYLPNDEIQIFDIETESFNPSLNIKKTIVQENVIRNLPHSFPKNITIEDIFDDISKRNYKSSFQEKILINSNLFLNDYNNMPITDTYLIFFDISGSMRGTHYKNFTENFIKFIESLPNTVNFNVIFSDIYKYNLFSDYRQNSPETQKLLKKVLESINPMGILDYNILSDEISNRKNDSATILIISDFIENKHFNFQDSIQKLSELAKFKKLFLIKHFFKNDISSDRENISVDIKNYSYGCKTDETLNINEILSGDTKPVKFNPYRSFHNNNVLFNYKDCVDEDHRFCCDAGEENFIRLEKRIKAKMQNSIYINEMLYFNTVAEFSKSILGAVNEQIGLSDFFYKMNKIKNNNLFINCFRNHYAIMPDYFYFLTRRSYIESEKNFQMIKKAALENETGF